MYIKTNGNLSGKVKVFYIQTFCMLFFDDTTFADDETCANKVLLEINKDEAEMYLSLVIEYGGRSFAKESREKDNGGEKSALLFAGREFYKLASEITGKHPPWGVHTGIRPQKTAEEYINKFGSDQAAAKLTEDYMMSPDKASLAVKVSANGKHILERSGKNKNDFSLYISIPFCPSRCLYCSFVSYSNKKLLDLIPAYTEKLISELKLIAAVSQQKNLNLRSVYIGGGTPTILECADLEGILKCVCENFNIDNGTEYTVEAGRADTLSEVKLDLMKKYNITRISVNPQTVNNETLKLIGRNHTAEDFYRAYELAKSYKFKAVNTDMIVGLTGENYDMILKTAGTLVSLAPENISVHSMCIKKSAEIKTNAEISAIKEQTLKNRNASEALQSVFLLLEKSGYLPYYMYKQKYAVENLENVGFSKGGFESVYNIYMMDEVHTVIGAGAGAITKIVNGADGSIERIANYKYPFEYIKNDLRL